MAKGEGRLLRVVRVLVMMLWFVDPSARGQAAPTPVRKLTLEEAVHLAIRNYPAVRARLEQVRAARAGVALSRTSYLPRLDALWQANRATRNNLFGQLLPQSVIPSLSGPVLPSTSGGSAWGSAAGVLFSWEPFDFGYRHATVEAAEQASERAGAEADLTRLDVAAAAADAFFSVVAADEEVRAAEADVKRRQAFDESLHVLVKNQLRPGADASRADAELAGAKIRLVEAEALVKQRQAALAETLGMADSDVDVEAGPLLGSPPPRDVPRVPVTSHPLVAAEKAGEEEAGARLRALSRSYVPHFDIQTAVSGRGSGAGVDGSFADGLNGLGLERANWVAGLTVTFPLFDFASFHARKTIALSNQRVEQARYDQAVEQLTGRIREARTGLEGARRVAENTPVQLRAARLTETQALASYQAGLATIVEVTEAQSLLIQAEVEDSLARLNVWRDLARLAASQGSLQPFLQILEQKSPGGR